MAVRAPVFTLGMVGLTELRLTAAAQHHKSVTCISLARKFEIPSRIPTECMPLSHHGEVEK